LEGVILNKKNKIGERLDGHQSRSGVHEEDKISASSGNQALTSWSGP
jgi:hypothetical protein